MACDEAFENDLPNLVHLLAVGLKMLPQIVTRGCKELWLNPGSESDELVAEAEKQGLNVIQACSIVAVGVSPHDLP